MGQTWVSSQMSSFNTNTLNLVTIDKDGARFEGPIVPDFCKTPSIIELQYKFPAGDTKVLEQKTIKYEIIRSRETCESSLAPEWMKVQELHQSNDIECLKSSCEIFNMWKCRMGDVTPIFIDISELMHRAMLRNKSLSRDILDNTDFCFCYHKIYQFRECCQPGVRSLSIATALIQMEISNWIVEIRHQAAHEHMPPVDFMRKALRFCREWPSVRYWSRPFSEVMKEYSKEICKEEHAKKRNSVLNRTYDSLDKFTKWRKKVIL
ncbi:las1-like domain-containing protein [Ditylenchus destructor]|nr:las1-like domain-containing protein [Ditylenchus destructor]